MTKIFEAFTCDVCGNIVKSVHASGRVLVCGGKTRVLQH